MPKTMRLTNHDLASALQGHPIMCSLDSGEEALLRLWGTPVSRDCLADERALRDNLPTVSVDRGDAVLIASGSTVLVTAGNTAGVVVQVRYMTADELIEAHVAACARVSAEPNLSRAHAEDLTRTIPRPC